MWSATRTIAIRWDMIVIARVAWAKRIKRRHRALFGDGITAAAVAPT